MPQPSAPEGGGAAQPTERRLESWGEIATYLHREIRTVQRWERNLGLPVHRLRVGKQASVFAYPSELDKWFKEREESIRNDKEEDSGANIPPPPAEVKRDVPPADDAASRTLAPPAAPQPVLAIDGPKATTGGEPATPNPPISAKKLWIASAIFVAAAGLFLSQYTATVQPRSAVASGQKLRLFVRPFRAIAGEREFSEGLTSEMITRLGRIDPQHLGVIAPTSSQQLGNGPISELASRLKLDYLVEGSVWRVNDKVRINVSLISARDETTLWLDSYTENMTDILKVQDQVAEAVAQKLFLSLPPAAGTSPASVDPEGYNSYLRGRRFWSVRDLSHSVPAFEEAVAKLPNYALAHSGLAASYAVMAQAPNDMVPSSISAPKARAEANRALALDPRSAEAHYVLGNLDMSFDFDFPAAEREFREAIRLEPNNPTAHQWLGQYFMTQNRLLEARSETQKALDLDPVSPIFTTTQAEVFYYQRDFNATISEAKLTLEQSPTFLLGEFWLASAYRETKMYPQALQYFRMASSLAPGNPALLTVVGHALAVSGDAAGARATLAQLATLSHQRYVPALYQAVVYMGLGDRNHAFHYLDAAVNEHDDRLIYLAVEPLADPLRSDVRFPKVLERLHLDNVSR
jgi:TolB-like protein/Flp pilus assembly protein TadD